MLTVAAAVGIIAVRVAGKNAVDAKKIGQRGHFKRDIQINVAFFFSVGGYRTAVHTAVARVYDQRICSHRTVGPQGGMAREKSDRSRREDRNGHKHGRYFNKAFQLNRNKHKITPLTSYVRGVIIISFGHKFFKAVKALFDVLHGCRI